MKYNFHPSRTKCYRYHHQKYKVSLLHHSHYYLDYLYNSYQIEWCRVYPAESENNQENDVGVGLGEAARPVRRIRLPHPRPLSRR